jgi:hypothetical protein
MENRDGKTTKSATGWRKTLISSADPGVIAQKVQSLRKLVGFSETQAAARGPIDDEVLAGKQLQDDVLRCSLELQIKLGERVIEDVNEKRPNAERNSLYIWSGWSFVDRGTYSVVVPNKRRFPST